MLQIKYEFQKDENYIAYQKDADKLLEKSIHFDLLEKIMKDKSVDEEEFKIIQQAELSLSSLPQTVSNRICLSRGKS
ncbi:MAG: hypothetical protein R2778_08375 [Saprospiraceae bacterium]